MTSFLRTDDPAWAELLGTLPHDFYHVPEYVALCATWDGGEPCAFVYRSGDDAMLAPLLLRPLPDALGIDAYDAISPYGYSAPIFSPNSVEGFRRDAIRAYVEAGRSEGIVTTLLRLHPILTFALPAPSEGDDWRTVVHGPTIGIDLSEDFEQWQSRLKSTRRWEIRKLMREGFHVRYNVQEDLLAFREIYRETMSRVDAADGYYFSNQYFDELEEVLGERLILSAVLSAEGEVAAAGMFVRTGDLVQYHLGGTSSAYLQSAPSKLMFFEMRNKMAAEGAHVLHLGGGVGAKKDSLYNFKASFAGREYSFATGRIVHDQALYQSLCKRTGRAEGAEASNFFPLYRLPR